MNDLRFAFRQLLKNPGFTAVAMLTLTLGIGATTSISCWLNALVLKPLPFPDADQLVLMSESWIEKGWGRSDVSAGTFNDWQQQASSFNSMVAFEETTLRMGAGRGEQSLRSLNVSKAFFEVLKTFPVLGRPFSAEEDQPGKDRVVILSHDLWQNRFNGRPDVIGAPLELDGTPFTIIGVMPAGFRFPYHTEVWTPQSFGAQELDQRDHRLFKVVGRLKAHVVLAAAQAELAAITTRIAMRFPATNRGWGSTLESLRVLYVSSDLRETFWSLLAAAAFVLLAACANVANLLLARSRRRQKEIAIRSSLGAGRWRIVHQMLTESLVLSGSGTIAGLLLAFWLRSMVGTLIPGDTLGGIHPGFDGRVFSFALGLCFVTGLAFGTVPAWVLTKPSPGVILKQAAGVFGASAGSRRWFNYWIICEVGCAVTLVIGAGLMILALDRLTRVDLGFDPNHLLIAEVNPKWDAQEPDYSPKKVLYFERSRDEMSRSAGISDAAIFRDDGWLDCLAEGEPDRMKVYGWSCSSNIFRTLRVPLVRGRPFPENWKKGEPIEVVVNETLAHRFWPGQNPLGKRFKPDSPGAMWTTVAGLVRDFQLDRDQEARPRFYTSYRSGAYLEGAQLLLRADGPITKAVASARQSLKGFDPYQTNPNVRTVNDVLSDALRSRFQILGLLIGFAGAALLLAAIGIYGVVSYLVAQRTHEVGIRIALGALPADVVSLVIRQGLAPVLVGIGCGILGALGLGHLLASRLFGVESTNPAVFAVSSIMMLLTAALACLFPARRAAKIDPIEALRYE